MNYKCSERQHKRIPSKTLLVKVFIDDTKKSLSIKFKERDAEVHSN